MEDAKSYYEKWVNFIENDSDPRVADWFLMNSPFPVFVISLVYLLSVKFALPDFMANRKACEIKWILWTYNLCHLVINLLFFYYALTLCWIHYNWRCEPVNTSSTGDPWTIARASWGFLMFKLTDLVETVILSFGKRYELVTNYHVAHHFLMPNMVWGVVKFLPGGHAIFFGFVNTFCHSIMYGYLLIIGLFPKIKKNISWFRHFRIVLGVTEIAVVVLHTLQLLIKNDCNFPVSFVYYAAIYGLLYLVLSTLCNYRKIDDLNQNVNLVKYY